jgi:hypothetical protein
VQQWTSDPNKVSDFSALGKRPTAETQGALLGRRLAVWGKHGRPTERVGRSVYDLV